MAEVGLQSLERFINRKRLFVRVQANVPRELFIQKLNAAFPNSRIGVGNASSERGPVTQRVADINYETAAEAAQALRRNRFKLKIGSHDADITYQIERKDVVEKLAGEWGCRFMVVVKNLPPGEISCAELSELFESAGEIFTIKILPGNRGEPYALVQYVEEQSVETSISQINQQKLHGAVLYVERHLKARRQLGNGSSTAGGIPASSGTSTGGAGAGSSPPASPPAQPSPAAAALQAGASTIQAGRSAAAVLTGAGKDSKQPQSQETSAAAIVKGEKPQSATQSSQQPSSQQQPSQQSAAASAASQQPQQHMSASQQPASQPSQTATLAQSAQQQQPPTAGAGAAAAGPPGSGLGSAAQPPSGSLFMQPYSLGGAAVPGQQGTGTTSEGTLGMGTTAGGLLKTQPPPSLGLGSAAVGGPGLLRGTSGAPGGTTSLGGSTPPSSQLLGGSPMLDLFSQLRSEASAQVGASTSSTTSTQDPAISLGTPLLGGAPGSGHLSAGGAGPASTSGLLSNGGAPHGGPQLGAGSSFLGGLVSSPIMNGGSVRPHGVTLEGAAGTAGAPGTTLGLGQYPMMGSLLRPGLSNGSTAPGLTDGATRGLGGILVGPSTGAASANGVAPSASQPGAAVPQANGNSTGGLRSPLAGTQPSAPAGGQPQQSASQTGALLSSNGLLGSQSASAAGQQQGVQGQVAGAAAQPPQQGGANLGLARISIRDALRLALGRLEELVTCPLTLEIMREPVTAADGYTYERTAIQNWMGHSDSSPVTSEHLPHKMLVPNRLAREIIQDILP